MASAVQICNMALSHIGSEARVSSISPPDGSAEAGHCAAFYDLARTELLEQGQWAFALQRAALAELGNASVSWAFAYALPSDCLRPLRVIQPSLALTVFTQDAAAHTDDRDSAPFDIEGEVLYSNTPEAVLLYAVDILDPTKFTPGFTAALAYNLAGYVAGPIIKGSEGVRIGDAMRQRAMNAGQLAAAASANASHAENNEVQTSITAARA